MDRQKVNPLQKNLKEIGIFGYRGFIGKHLSIFLSSHHVSFNVFEGDALQKSDIENFFYTTNVREIIFLIGSFELPMDNLLQKNLLTLQSVLDVGVKNGLQKIIYVSSGAVYGNPGSEGSFETDLLLPTSLYGLIKKYCEECIHYYEENYGIKGVLLRFPNVYGDGNDKGVVYEFLQRIQNKQEIMINGDGSQGRNFLHVSDAVHAIYKSLRVDESEVFNVANDRKITINELVKILAQYQKFDITYLSSKDILYDTLYLNTSKCIKILGLIPHFDVETYIRQKFLS